MVPPVMRILVGILFLLHALFGIAIAVGIILLLAWAIKHWSANKLKTWGMWFVGIGLIGYILLGGIAFAVGGGHPGMKRWDMMQKGNGTMMDDDQEEYDWPAMKPTETPKK